MARNAQLAIAVLIGLAAGVAAAWLLRPVETRVSPPQRTAVANPVDKFAQEEPAPQTSNTPSSRAPSLPDVLPSPPGPGTVRGVVTWTDGAPCAGLPVVAERTFATPPGLRGSAEATPAERLAYYEALVAWHEAHTLRAATGDDGRFDITGLHDGSYRVSSGDPERAFTKPWVTCKAGDELSLTVRRVVQVEFDFELATGEKPDLVKLKVSSEAGQMNYFQHWVSGRAYPVAPGKFRVEAQGGPRELWKANEEIEAPPGGFGAPVRVVLKPANALVVHREQPDPYYAIMVRVVATPQVGRPVTLAEASAGISSWVSWWPNPSIHEGLTPGRYSVVMMFSRSGILTQQEVEFEGGIQEVTVKMPSVRREDHVVLRVYGPEGEPLEKQQVNIKPPGQWSAPAVIDRGGGEYWAYCIPPEGAPEPGQTYSVTVESQFGSRVETFALDFRGEIEVRFGRKAKLVVHLDNLPAQHARLVLGAAVRGGGSGYSDRYGKSPIAVEARTEFELASGPAVISLGVREGEWMGTKTVYRREVNLAPGDNEERIDLARFGTLKVRVPAGVEYINLRGPRDEQLRPKDRVVEFVFVEAGECMLDSDTGVMKVTAPGEVAFEPQPYNALRVLRLDSAGVLAAVGVQADDLVRAIGDTELSGRASLLHVSFRNAADAGSVTLRLQRGARTLTVRASAEQWKSLKDYRLSAQRVNE